LSNFTVWINCKH